MALNNIDNQIREKLQSRELQPSANSWDRLDAMLTVSEEKKPKKGFGWFFIAAAVTLVFGIVFFMQNDTTGTPNSNAAPVVTNEISIDTVEIKKNEKNIPFVLEQQPLVQAQNKNQQKIESRQQFAENRKQKTENRENIAENRLQKTEYIQHPTYSKYVTAESLLADVQNTSESKLNPSKPKIKIDANSLLLTAEKELDQDYRENTLEKIKRNFNEVKTAVANRNYE